MSTEQEMRQTRKGAETPSEVIGEQEASPATGGGDSDRPKSDLKVGDVATSHDSIPTCSMDLKLSQVAELLLNSGQMGAAVIDEAGLPIGLVTERDILRAYFQGAPWDCTIGEWFRGKAVAPRAAAAAAAAPAAGSGDAVPAAPAAPPKAAPKQPAAQAPAAAEESKVQAGDAWSQAMSDALLELMIWPEAMAEALGSQSLGTVSEMMEPVVQVPVCPPDITMHQLLQSLLASPSHAVLVADDRGVHGLATAEDAMWAFGQQIGRNSGAWPALAGRPGLLELERRLIEADTPMQRAVEAMLGAGGAAPPMRHLIAVQPGGRSVVGLLSSAHLARAPEQRKHNKMPADGAKPKPVTLADVAGQRDTPICSIKDTLIKAANTMLETGRSAAVVMDGGEGGHICGVLTENDILEAFVDGESWECSLEVWLRGGECRLPGFMVSSLTLSPTASLAEAASSMASMASMTEMGESNFACHHLLVCEPRILEPSDKTPAQCPKARILSALDIVNGIVMSSTAEATSQGSGGPKESTAAVLAASKIPVSQVMKPRALVPDCALGDCLAHAFGIVSSSRQGCAILVDGGEVAEKTETETAEQDIAPQAASAEADKPKPEARKHRILADSDGGPVYGIITTADVLKVFSDRLGGTATQIGDWLRNLNQERHSAAQRTISADKTLVDAAAMMSKYRTHHLVVVMPKGSEVLGVLSALDIVCALSEIYRQTQRTSEVRASISTVLL